jgi:hypothetical protein
MLKHSQIECQGKNDPPRFPEIRLELKLGWANERYLIGILNSFFL